LLANIVRVIKLKKRGTGHRTGVENLRMHTECYSERMKRTGSRNFISALSERIFCMELFMFLVSAKQWL
jgi:hypothetical protein